MLCQSPVFSWLAAGGVTAFIVVWKSDEFHFIIQMFCCERGHWMQCSWKEICATGPLVTWSEALLLRFSFRCPTVSYKFMDVLGQTKTNLKIDMKLMKQLRNLSWKLATLQFRDEPLLSLLASQAICVSDTFKQNLLKALKALCYDSLCEAVERLHEFDTQCIANRAWASATLRVKDDLLMELMSTEVVPRQREKNTVKFKETILQHQRHIKDKQIQTKENIYFWAFKLTAFGNSKPDRSLE